jgi:Protein of unknown function (DUF2844)
MQMAAHMRSLVVCRSRNGSFAFQFVPRRVAGCFVADLGSWRIRVAAFIVAVLAFPLPALPTLGKSEASIRQDKLVLQTEQVKVQSRTGYRCQVLSSEMLTVKEYVNPKTKVVFGISWSGTRIPPLKQLLGFDPGALKGTQTLRTLHFTRIVTSNVIFEMSAIMNHYAGSVVRTDLLPKRVNAKQVAP